MCVFSAASQRIQSFLRIDSPKSIDYPKLSRFFGVKEGEVFGQNKLEIFHKEACEREVTVVVLECNSTIFL